MKRDIDLTEITDGRLYTSGEMVKADCHGCGGCSSCCRGMGDTILLDPMDIWRIRCGTGKDFQSLMENGNIELGVSDGMIIPHLKMDPAEDRCTFLSRDGRCTIHDCRPGLCRLFPLGRYYEEGGFRYFLQIHECSCRSRGKIKIKKWLGIPDLKTYETYISDWHSFLLECEKALETLEDSRIRILTLYVIKVFFEKTYLSADENGFYSEFYGRLLDMKKQFGF